MKTDVIQAEHPVLRRVADEIPLDEISSSRIQHVVKKLSESLVKEDDGVAIAAPQIGESVRIFVISGRILWHIEHEEDEEITPPKKYPADMVFINPKITKLSKETRWLEEGCLSVRYLYGKIKRSTKATVRAYDEHGKLFERGASGLLAQIFQHETDHLDGKLFIDRAKDIEDLPPEKMNEAKSKKELYEPTT